MSYDWPGNVREVRNVVERALVICTNDTVTPQYLPARIRTKVTPEGVINIPVGCSTQEAERILILQTLASAGNNKAKAAKILGVSRKTLHNKLNSFQQTLYTARERSDLAPGRISVRGDLTREGTTADYLEWTIRLVFEKALPFAPKKASL